MNNKVQVNVKGITEDSGVVDVDCEGRYGIVREVEYIKYDEVLDEADVKISNMIKLKKSCVEMIKKGPMSSHMTFIPGQTTTCIYDTPYGALPMEVHTKSVNVIRTDDRLRIVMEYKLGMGEKQQIDCQVDVCVTSL